MEPREQMFTSRKDSYKNNFGMTIWIFKLTLLYIKLGLVLNKADSTEFCSTVIDVYESNFIL
jgi:hypothetical protein